MSMKTTSGGFSLTLPDHFLSSIDTFSAYDVPVSTTGTFIFTGKVLPIFKQFTMVGSVSFHVEEPFEPGVTLMIDVSVSINKGIVEVKCDSNLFGNDNYDGRVDLQANYFATAIVNTYGFAEGLGLRVVLEQVKKPNGVTYNIHAHRPHLQTLVSVLCPAADGGVDVRSVMEIVVHNPTIFVALSDLINAVSFSPNAPLYCGRAVDAIRQSMTPADDRKKSWEILREALNLSQQYLEYITEQSKGPRHGSVTDIPFSDIHETTDRAWVVMNRFLELKKRRVTTLPLSEFPIL